MPGDVAHASNAPTPRRVLHVLSQRPGLTGSGVTLDALVCQASGAGWQQAAVVGVPAGEPDPVVGGLPHDRVRPLRFETDELPFAVPGMSDVMPYPSTRFSAMDEPELAAYRYAWQRHLTRVIEEFSPSVVHCHHLWIVGSMIADIAPGLPVVSQCHATGLRQMSLCPHLRDSVVAGCRRNGSFIALDDAQRDVIAEVLSIPLDRITVAGAGYDDSVFHHGDGGLRDPNGILYVGKYSAAKGVPFLLDAFARVHDLRPETVLHVAGTGTGPEAEELRRRLQALAPDVVLHGQLGHADLADLMRRCAVCVLPSMYEGIPLVLVEAFACGCRLVATRLPGVLDPIVPYTSDAIELVPMPRLHGPDTPHPEDVPRFIDDLARALDTTLERRPLRAERPLPRARNSPSDDPFTWSAVFRRIERVWQDHASARTAP